MEYLYLEPIKKKVRLLAKDRRYKMECGDHNSIEFGEETERILAYLLYIGGTKMGDFYSVIQDNIPNKVWLANNPEVFRSAFEQQHPLEDAEDHNWKEIPMYANQDQGMALVSDGKKHSVWITREDEDKMLEYIKADACPWVQCRTYIHQVFMKHHIPLHDKYVTGSLYSFMMQHGLNAKEMEKQYEEYNIQRKVALSTKEEGRNKKRDQNTIGAALFFVFIGVILHILPIVNSMVGNLWPIAFLILNIAILKAFVWQDTFGDVAGLFLAFYVPATTLYIVGTVYNWDNFILAFTYLLCALQGLFVVGCSIAAMMPRNKNT